MVHFVLICEGSSDEALIPHLRSLLVECGIKEATGVAPDFDRLPERRNRDVESKVLAALELESNVDVLFIHRDADSVDPNPRYDEISAAIGRAGYTNAWIGVVPVQETEAWLLLDERAIRRVSGRPNGRVVLNLPTPNLVERLPSPKEKLLHAILLASETSGRRYKTLKRKLPALRANLLTELKLGGPLNSLSSWARLKRDVEAFVRGYPTIRL